MKTLFFTVILFILSLLSFTKTVNAQDAPDSVFIKGTVLDSLSGQPLDFLTVNLLSDSVVVLQSDYTKEDGSFSFAGLQFRRYSVVVVGVGHQPRQLEVDLTHHKQSTFELPHILMRQQETLLKGVTVSAVKPIIKQEVDRITYDLQADPESKVFSVLEMMRKVPYLALDANDNILMKGNTDFKILINGKPSSMVERSYKEILRSMPASSIERIEVITTPPAKYDAEGIAGIINIITNKRLDNGYNGSVNVNERFPVGGPGFGGTLSAKFGKWGMSAFAGGSRYRNPQTSSSINRSTAGDFPSLLRQEGTDRSDSKSGYLGYEVSYEVDSLNLISGQLNLNANNSDGVFTQASQMTEGLRNVQKYALVSNNRGMGDGFDAALNYQKGFKADKNRLLTFSYRYFQFKNNQNNQIDISDRMDYVLPDYHQINEQGFSEHTFQIDYVYPVRKLTVEAGIKGILRNNSSDFQYLSFDEPTGQYQPDPLRTNQFLNAQHVYGLYNTYQYSHKKWSIKGGVRIENTIISADFISTDSEVDQHYLNLIPSVALNYKMNDKSGINMGYSQRIQRPGIYQLNPFVDRTNPNFERTGNPDLQPSTVNDIQISYNLVKKYTLNAGIGFAFFNELIFPVVVHNPETQITRSSYGNTGNARLPMVNMSLNYPITKRWNSSVNVRTAYGIVEGVVNEVTIKNRGLMYHMNISSGYRFDKNWRINGNLNISGPNLSFQGTTNSRVVSSFSVNKDLIKDKLTFAAAVNNPFSKFRNDYRETFGTGFFQENFRVEYFRNFNVSLNYRFGKLKDAIRKNKRGIRNDDVQSGS